MRNILFILITCTIFLFGLWGCTEQKFEATNTIATKVLSADDENHDIAIEYYIGKLLVLDELDNIKQAQYAYILKHKDDDLHLTLEIVYDDGGG